ncbi:type II toxin-antitoxin system PemK/MazF family toxin [Propionimicrobium sp. PCR01-08-3]|uniref:type II toxin-antitoxin system PemK/MazF family toxin n=1 Tax=Propionimicrobium sp. PCR01-08-3 TaxID=3052086 RepID=UPI00255C6E0A|nr:type II toxin-antitoxin system PemK/MazF family toxin [Propionimicrobium sp. PCR01-08-3]WIY82817.1 type II toxin-antitoxin system PemK/MazF family toxin [Propionimicrobium sp. PCR01-08-3]
MQWKDLRPLARLAGKVLRDSSSSKPGSGTESRTTTRTRTRSGVAGQPGVGYESRESTGPNPASKPGGSARQRSMSRPGSGVGRAPVATGQPLTDFDGLPEMRYQAKGPGGYESGQMVWTWVAYEEDASQGKDRPVLLIGTDAGWLLGTPATSKDHDRDKDQESRAGRFWVEIGRGEWDKKQRISEVRTDRVIRIDPTKVRRPAGYVSNEAFQKVVAGITKHWDD